MGNAENYRVDDATFISLSRWVDENVTNDPDGARIRIVDFLESESEEDAEFHMGHGWDHIYRLIFK
jgi:hypothetical protein